MPKGMEFYLHCLEQRSLSYQNHMHYDTIMQVASQSDLLIIEEEEFNHFSCRCTNTMEGSHPSKVTYSCIYSLKMYQLKKNITRKGSHIIPAFISTNSRMTLILSIKQASSKGVRPNFLSCPFTISLLSTTLFQVKA